MRCNQSGIQSKQYTLSVDEFKLMGFFFLMFINLIQQINYAQHRYNNCDHEAKLMIRNRIASIKTRKKKNSKTELQKRLNIHSKREKKGEIHIK